MSRAAIVGTGYVARVHAHVLRDLGVSVVAVCGRTRAGADALGRELRVAAYDDLAHLLDTEQVEVLHVCTPNARHAEQTLLALERGLHVVCEKPLAVSSAEAAAMVEAAARVGRVAATCYHVRGYPLVRRMRAEVQSGGMGAVFSVHGRYLCDDLLVAPGGGGWRVEPAVAGPSYVVGDLGTHWLDLAEYVTGLRVTEVFAEFVGEPLEDYSALLLRLDHGVAGSLLVSAGASGRKNQLLFECEAERGGLTWDQEEPNVLLSRSANAPTRLVMKESGPDARYPAGHAEGYGGAFRNVFADVYRAIAGEPHDQYPTFEDGLRGVSLVEAAVASAREGRWVTVA
jgi:predicted dehydrogenase